jgi:hypothetical protein
MVIGCEQSVSEGKLSNEQNETTYIPEDNVKEQILPESSNTLSFPELGYYESGKYYPFIYAKVNNKYYLHVNIYGRGRGSKDSQTPDTFVLQGNGNGGDFPVGKWVSKKNSNEYLEFTPTRLTRASPFLGELLCTYAIEDGILYFTKIISIYYGE